MLDLRCCIFLITTSTVQACPDYRLMGQQIHASSSDLYNPYRFDVIAGGSIDLQRCRIRADNASRVFGWVSTQPDFTLRYYRSQAYQLDFRAVGSCDTVLLVNTGNANWFFSDDRDGTQNPRVRLTRPSDGWYDIWVGTYGPSTCTAQLVIETFR